MLAVTALSQPNRYGVPIITNYPYFETGGSEQNWWVTQDSRGVVYVGNYEKGILEYDGVEWRQIPIHNNSPVRSLVTGDDGMVYVGTGEDFGRLVPDVNGQLHFHSLCDSSIQNTYSGFDIWKTYLKDGKVYFCSMMYLFVYNPLTDSVNIIDCPEDPYLSFVLNDELYHSNWGRGLMRLDGEEFRMMPGGGFFKEKAISGIEQLNENRFIISTFFNGIYLYDPQSGALENDFLDPALNETFMQDQITYMMILNNNILVCTFYNGLYILDFEGKIIEIISDVEGLYDKTISHVYADERVKGAGPLWIAHWKGVSKVEANNPFRKFTRSAGFDGLIMDMEYFGGELFIATLGGLFYKHSTPTLTRFLPLPEVTGQIYDLQEMSTTSGNRYLLATSDICTFVINEDLEVSLLSDNLVSSNQEREDVEELTGNYIIQDPDDPDQIYMGINHLVGLRFRNGRWHENFRFREVGDAIIHISMDRYGFIWLNTASKVIRLDPDSVKDGKVRYFDSSYGLPEDKGNWTFTDPETREVLIGSRQGFYRFNYQEEYFFTDTIHNSILPDGWNQIRTFCRDGDGDYWYSFENQYTGWIEMVGRKTGEGLEVFIEEPFQRLPNASVDAFEWDREGGMWLSKADELYHFDKHFSRNDSLPFRTFIRSVELEGDSLIFKGAHADTDADGRSRLSLFQGPDQVPLIRYRQNNIRFSWAAPYFEQEDQLEYSYYLEGLSKEWSQWSRVPFVAFNDLKYGRYVMKVKAKNVYGNESEPALYAFTISRPWYARIVAYILYILLAALLVYLIIKIYTRRLKNENIRLEGIIQERTAEIRKQKEELTDSIEYASRIQRAMLPSRSLLEEHKMENFILFRPRDIVSGDFYWIGAKNSKLLIVAADCTGHGVPGAFMSMLGMTFLDEIVIKSEITDTAEIMEALREHVTTSLEQSDHSEMEMVKDGMDLAMISVDLTTRRIQYSGAYNPLYLVRPLKKEEIDILEKGEEMDLPRGSIHDTKHILIQISADQMPIGVSEKNLPFSSAELDDEGYAIYMFSDGYLDQFGGPQGKKFMSKNFKKLLLELQSVPMKKQGAELEKVLINWMGEISQIDDILVMGLKLNPR